MAEANPQEPRPSPPTAEAPMLRVCGPSAVHDVLGDLLVYRNLAPCDPRLPELNEARRRLGVDPGPIPRKHEDGYAAVVAELLRLARSFDAPGTPIRRLIYLGDTRLSDGTAFRNLCQAGHWPGMAFIGGERQGPAALEHVEGAEARLFVGSRWEAVYEFADLAASHGGAVDEHTAVVLDLDKTVIGARGRNDHVIDRVRVQAVEETVSELLGNAFDSGKFVSTYQQLNTSEFHPFTADNQDYLAYTCLVLGAGVMSSAELVRAIRQGSMRSFDQFIHIIDSLAERLPHSLRTIHHEILNRVELGDPTPFKAFRFNEYLGTVRHMGRIRPGDDLAALLQRQIVLTQEVVVVAEYWRRLGALLFGLSDKPDEAALPSSDLARQGYLPIHRIPTSSVGVVR